ncbi:hypothetical protein [Streptomyces sp. CRN 30]|uniref:hypothetical protein n=1 Tax=Streptomyces sp. CRN 30 TaxID=3075613 RepID=UPI002A7F2A91|nr:hypothetical protein [Streptomyces sp. CRN 30]
MVEVDLLVSNRLSAETAADVESGFRALGLTATVRVLPTRRSAELSWLVLATLPLVSFLNAVGAKAAEGAVQSLRDVVRRMFTDKRAGTGASRALVLQDVGSSAQVILDPDLPAEGYRALFTGDLPFASGATFRFDPVRGAWVAD